MATTRPRPDTGSWLEHGPLSIRTERDPSELFVVELYGELDLSGAEIFSGVLERVQESDVQEIIIDLSGLHFIDSTGLALLVRAHQREKEGANRMAFLHGPDPVQRVFDLTRLSERLPFAD